MKKKPLLKPLKQHGKSPVHLRVIAGALLLSFLSLFWCVPSFAADGTDLFSGASQDIFSSFGSNSTFVHVLLLIEAIAGGFAYIKTRSITALAGILILMAFTHYALTVAAPAT